MGLFKKSKKKASGTPKVICRTGDAGSYKCIFLASYRKLPIDLEWSDSSSFEDEMAESMHLTGLNRFPCVEDGDLTVCGVNAVMTYLNIKGTEHTIHPRKARVLAMQQYWIQVLMSKLEPLLDDVANNKNAITNILDNFNQTLTGKDYIVGEFSLADIHWSAVLKVLEEKGNSELFSGYENIDNWLTRMKTDIPSYKSASEKVAA